MNEDYQKVANRLRHANRIAVLTGAGISAESGVPTFRGAGGLWEKYDPEELVTATALYRDPETIWKWYIDLKKLMHESQPNPAHHALAALERKSNHFSLITQNIDNLDYRAGSQNIYEIHGNMFVTRCTKCSYSTRDFPLSPEDLPPSCPNCSALLRPDIVLFGEMLPAQMISQSFRDAENCDVMLVIGTSGLVTPAANIPYLAKRSGAYLVEINIERTPLTRLMDKSFFGKAGDILPKIVELV